MALGAILECRMSHRARRACFRDYKYIVEDLQIGPSPAHYIYPSLEASFADHAPMELLNYLSHVLLDRKPFLPSSPMNRFLPGAYPGPSETSFGPARSENYEYGPSAGFFAPASAGMEYSEPGSGEFSPAESPYQPLAHLLPILLANLPQQQQLLLLQQQQQQQQQYLQMRQEEEEALRYKSHLLPEIRAPAVYEEKLRALSNPVSVYPRVDPSNFTYSSHVHSGMTSLVNSNSNVVVPLVELAFVDQHVCTVCGRRITRDMTRHMRTHQTVARFTCKFPRSQCRHKTGRFNRPYDFKKHLLNRHFRFDNPEVKKLHNLSDKLDHWGTCPCGLRFVAKDWLDSHILTEVEGAKCHLTY